MRKKTIIRMSVLKGEPTDGTGRICIHLFVQDKDGSFTEPHALHQVVKDGVVVKQALEAKPTRGRLACDPKRDPAPVTKNGVTTITSRTDDHQAVTCPRCIASAEYKKMIEILNGR